MRKKGASQGIQVLRDVTRRVEMRYIFIDLLPLPFLSNYSYYCSQIVSVQYLFVCLSVFKIIFQNSRTHAHNTHYITQPHDVPRTGLENHHSFIYALLNDVLTDPALHVGLVVQNGPRGCTHGTFAIPLKLFSIVVSRPENKNIFILCNFFRRITAFMRSQYPLSPS